MADISKLNSVCVDLCGIAGGLRGMLDTVEIVIDRIEKRLEGYTVEAAELRDRAAGLELRAKMLHELADDMTACAAALRGAL